MKVQLQIKTHESNSLIEQGCTLRDIILIPETAEDKQFFEDWNEDNCHTEIYEGKDGNWHIVI